MGVVTALAYGIYPIGYVLAGILVETYGVVTALGVFAVASVLLALLASVAPALKRLDEEPLVEESVTTAV
jgi:MFS family permease